MASYAIVTFGCRVNQADSLACEHALVERGAVAATPETADVVIVNSCSVTASADQGTRQVVRRVARANPRARIVVTGCYATRDAATVRELPGVVHVVDNADKDSLVEDLDAALGLAARSPSTGRSWFRGALTPIDGDGPCGQSLAPGLGGRTAFALRAQTGCDEPCAYCIIPSTRGRGRSQPIEALTEQVTRLEAAGYREVVLTGVHLGSYGRDLTPRRSLAQLLRALVTTTTSVLYRVGSLEPMDCTSEVLEVLTGHPSVAPHFHLPLQHASDHVLQAMRRPYRLAYYADLVNDIRRRLPHASIGTDVMAGFPGESDAAAELMALYLEASPLSHLHVFPYSDRSGTEASAMAGKVPGVEVRARATRLRAVGQGLSAAFRQRQLGTRRPALTVDDGTMALTDNYLKVHLTAGRPRNRRVTVRIDRVEPALTATVVEDDGQL